MSDDTTIESMPNLDSEEPVEVSADAAPTNDPAANDGLDAEVNLLDDLQRVAAEFENFKKRAIRDQDELVDRATQRLVIALLPVLDSFDQAMTHEPQTPSEEQLMSGLSGTYEQMMNILGAEGLDVVAADGSFDPTVHEAVGGGGDGQLVVDQTLRRGYSLRGRVVRPALITVAEAEDSSG